MKQQVKILQASCFAPTWLSTMSRTPVLTCASPHSSTHIPKELTNVKLNIAQTNVQEIKIANQQIRNKFTIKSL